MLSTGGSREIALRDNMINGWAVIYEQRLEKVDLSSQRRQAEMGVHGEGA